MWLKLPLSQGMQSTRGSLVSSKPRAATVSQGSQIPQLPPAKGNSLWFLYTVAFWVVCLLVSLGHSCFTMLIWFLLCSDVNQPHVYSDVNQPCVYGCMNQPRMYGGVNQPRVYGGVNQLHACTVAWTSHRGTQTPSVLSRPASPAPGSAQSAEFSSVCCTAASH